MKCANIFCWPKKRSGAPGLVDRVFAFHAGSRGFDSNRRHMSERFFRSNRPEYPHPVCSELENSGIRVAISDWSVTERRGWCPPYQTGETVHVHTNTLRRRCARPWFSTAESLGERRYESWITHTHIFCWQNKRSFHTAKALLFFFGKTWEGYCV